MSSAAQVAPADARADLEALRADLPRAEALLERREQEFRDARRSGATPERLEELAQRRDTAATLLEYHRADVEELERHVAELDSRRARRARPGGDREGDGDVPAPRRSGTRSWSTRRSGSWPRRS